MNPTKEEIEKALSWADLCERSGTATEGALVILAAAYRDAIKEIEEMESILYDYIDTIDRLA